MINRKKVVLLFIIATLLLASCGNPNAHIKEEELPKSVLNGTLSEEFFHAAAQFTDDFLPVANEMSSISSDLILDRATFSEKSFRVRVEKYLEEQKKVISTYEGIPITDADKEMDDIIRNYIEMVEYADNVLMESLEMKSKMTFTNGSAYHFAAEDSIEQLLDLFQYYETEK